jgi:hypothetical protein
MNIISLPGEEAVKNAVLQIAQSKLKNLVVDVLVEDDIDLDGSNCLRITLILKSSAILLSRGEQLNEISLGIADYLREHEDKRSAYLHYATRAELEASKIAND